jgi:adenylate kinase
MKDVKAVFAGFYCEIDANQEHAAVYNDIERILKLRLKSNAPRRPPHVLLVGPPGSGKTTLARLVAKKYGLVHVSGWNLLNAEIAAKSQVGRIASQLITEGSLVPDEHLIALVEARLNATDCKVNGWVLEGFPKTEAQIRVLKDMKQPPSLVVVLHLPDEIVFERHEYKKIDPMTGMNYNLKEAAPEDAQVAARLVTRECDKHEIVKKRLKSWKDFLPKLEETYKAHRLTLTAEKPLPALVEAISEAIENPIS